MAITKMSPTPMRIYTQKGISPEEKKKALCSDTIKLM